MIELILNLLTNQLSDYILTQDSQADAPPVVLGNIGLSQALGGNESYMQGRIVLSLVNIMEESTLKNTSPYQRFGNHSELLNPPAFLNLFLLFTANFNSSQGSSSPIVYSNSMIRLSQVIEFFQSKRLFSIQNSPDANVLQNPNLQAVKIKMDLMSLSFEQVNHLWGSLGGKQIPYVMYKAWVTPVSHKLLTSRGSLIQDIQTNSEQIVNP